MIQRTWRVALLFILSTVLMLKLGSALGPQGWLWSSVALLTFWVLVMFFSDLRLPQVLRGRRLEGQDPWGLQQELKALCQKARLPLPKVFIFSSSTPTALSFGRSWRSSHLFITESLLTVLTREELRAVLALELAKIKRLDILPQTLATGLTSWNLWLQRAPQDVAPHKGPLSSLRAGLGRLFKKNPLASAARALAKFCIGPKTYYLSDQLASEYAGGPEVVARVLWKLESYSLSDPLPSPQSLGHLFVVEPAASQSAPSYCRPQPAVRQRIERLVGHYPV